MNFFRMVTSRYGQMTKRQRYKETLHIYCYHNNTEYKNDDTNLKHIILDIYK